MATTKKPIIGFPNHLDSTFTGSSYNTPVISGGSWLSTRPLTNLKDELLINKARSSDASAASAFIHFDLGITRDVKLFAIPTHNIGRTGQYRLRASAAAAWSGVTINGSHSSGATTLNISTGSTAVTITTGDGFTIAGDSTVYQPTADASIAASSSGAILIERVDDSGTGLSAGLSGGEAVTCHAGDMTDTLLDTGLTDVWEVIYGEYTLYYGHPSLADGKIEPDKLAQRRNPIVYINQTDGAVDVARYWRLDISDTSNADGYIELSRAFFCPGWEPTKGMQYDMRIGRFSNSTLSVSKGGAEIPNRQNGGRVYLFGISNIPENEGMSFLTDLQEDADITKQIFFAMDKTDTVHKHRRMFTARMRKLDPLTIPYYERMDAVLELSEVVA